MKALILAAGDGDRLGSYTKDKPKALVKLLGISLIERVILTAKQAGINEFLVVCGYLGEKLMSDLGNGDRFGISIKYIDNEDWQRGNAVSALKAKDFLDEKFILLMSDHIFDSRILTEIIKHDTGSSIVLAVDKKEPSEEDMEVREKRGKIIEEGKGMEKSGCIDTGIFLCSPNMFSYLEETVEEGRTELSDCINLAAKNGDAEIFDITQINSYASKMRKEIEPWWIDIDTEKDLTKAQEMIIENASKNPSDALAHYIHKPIENKLVAILSTSNITPNQLTIIVNVLAYTVTALFFVGYLLPASILSFVVGIADGLDGKLARVKLKTSKLGSLEHSFDLLFEFSWFIALSWFLFRATQTVIPLILCIFIILFIAFYRHIYDQFRRASGRSLDDSGDFERRFKRIAGRRNLYNIPILIGVLLVPSYSLIALTYSLIFISFHSGITAIVYSVRAVKHLHAMDNQIG
ncbi:MAG: NTP transferase domain-containing protein [Desulfobacteraceae bacterium]|nr:NTP transferase domain-containing protein [Desulfobacteraceae bacterium]